MRQCKFSLYLKKAGLASRNIVHFLKKVILRCIGLCFNYHHLYLLSRLDQPLIQRIPAGLSSTVACLDITHLTDALFRAICVRGTRTHPNFVPISVYRQEILRYSLCEDCRLGDPPGFFRGFGPRCRAPRFRIRMLRHAKHSAERTPKSLITASYISYYIDGDHTRNFFLLTSLMTRGRLHI